MAEIDFIADASGAERPRDIATGTNKGEKDRFAKDSPRKGVEKPKRNYSFFKRGEKSRFVGLERCRP